MGTPGIGITFRAVLSLLCTWPGYQLVGLVACLRKWAAPESDEWNRVERSRILFKDRLLSVFWAA